MKAFTPAERSNSSTEQGPYQKTHEHMVWKETFCTGLDTAWTAHKSRKAKDSIKYGPTKKGQVIIPLEKHHFLLLGSQAGDRRNI